MELNVKKLHPDAKLPEKAHDDDAGIDFFSIDEGTLETRPPYDFNTFGTGVAIQIQKGHVGILFDRSGMATKNRIERCAGVIDAGYRGEVKVALANRGWCDKDIHVGDKIAQMVIFEIPDITIVEVDELNDTERGGKGFGSTDNT